MKVKSIFLVGLVSYLMLGTVMAQTTIMSTLSCRTEGGTNADVNKYDSNKLSVRNTSSGNKSWIKFELGDLDVSKLDSAILTVALHEGKTGSQSCEVSYVNDDYRENINWGERDITWNNAPGNNPDDLGVLNPVQTTLLGTISFKDGFAGDTYDIDVLAALQSDTDGIVQFVLHNSPNLLNFSTYNHSIEAQRPRLTVTERYPGANYPVPDDKDAVETSLSELSWTNPEPNTPGGHITCTVYLGTDPNRPFMNKVTLPADAETVELTAAKFPNFVPLVNKTTYYWIVDCLDSSTSQTLPGQIWSFYTDDNQAPTVELGNNLVNWLGASGISGTENITITPVLVEDDGLPEGQSLSYTWTQVDNGAPAAAINSVDQKVTSVTFTERGTYEFMLTVSDTVKEGSDTIQVIVGDNSCDASHMATQTPYNPGDQNQDCMVDLEDLITLIAANWLDCSDTLANCGN